MKLLLLLENLISDENLFYTKRWIVVAMILNEISIALVMKLL